MSGAFRIGIFSPNDPRPWVRASNLDLMIDHESRLVEALRSRGYEVVRGGEGLPRDDQIAWSTSLVQEHVGRIADARPAVLIINQGSWTFPYDSIDAAKLFAKITGDTLRLVMFSYKDTKVPGLVAGMAAGGGLKRIGIPFASCYGRIDQDPAVLDHLEEILGFYRSGWEAVPAVRHVLDRLPFQKYLALGGMSLKMATTAADVDQWQKVFGISYEALDQSELTDRAIGMVEWEGEPGESACEILDTRVSRAASFLIDEGHGSFDFTREKMRGPEKSVLQLAYYYAALDLVDELGVTFAGIKCQDELNAKFCTVCPAAAFLNNDIGPDGEVKRVIPVACENDMNSSLSQLLLYLLTGAPAAFGDFRDV